MECAESVYTACGWSAHWLQGPADHGLVTTKTLNRFVLAWQFRNQGRTVERSWVTLRVYSCVGFLSDKPPPFQSEGGPVRPLYGPTFLKRVKGLKDDWETTRGTADFPDEITPYQKLGTQMPHHKKENVTHGCVVDFGLARNFSRLGQGTGE